MFENKNDWNDPGQGRMVENYKPPGAVGEEPVGVATNQAYYEDE